MMIFGINVLMSVLGIAAVLKLLIAVVFVIVATSTTIGIGVKIKKNKIAKQKKKMAKSQVKDTKYKLKKEKKKKKIQDKIETKAKKSGKTVNTPETLKIDKDVKNEDCFIINGIECKWVLNNDEKKSMICKDLDKIVTSDKKTNKILIKYPKSNEKEELLSGPSSVVNQIFLPNWLEYQIGSKDAVYPVEINQGNEKTLLKTKSEAKEYKLSIDKLSRKQKPAYIEDLSNNSEKESIGGEREQ